MNTNRDGVGAVKAPGAMALILLIFGAALAAAPAHPGASVTRIVYPDGSKFAGVMKDGLRHGPGRFVWPDGSEYRGGFVRGAPDGEGIHTYPDGKRRRVWYDEGRLARAVRISNPERRGELVFGAFFREGRYRGWYRGDHLRGEVPHGRGVMRYSNGSVYSGQWKDGKMHGNGCIRWNDGSLYAGQWRAGKRTGFGTYTWANGDRYVGGWNDNRMCGKGTFYHQDGRITAGIWDETTVPAHE